MKSAILQFYYQKHIVNRANKEKGQEEVSTKRILVRGLKETPQLVIEFGDNMEGDEVEILTSYLNQLSLTIEKWKLATENILKASLDGKALNKVQDETAKMLCYACIHEFIEDNYGRKEGGRENAGVSFEVTNSGATERKGEDTPLSLLANDTKEKQD